MEKINKLKIKKVSANHDSRCARKPACEVEELLKCGLERPYSLVVEREVNQSEKERRRRSVIQEKELMVSFILYNG
jgi:hypothetical protein